MKKSDLKSGMIIETRGGELGLLVDTNLGLLIQFDDTYEVLDGYDDDLSAKDYIRYDIIKVREITSRHHVCRDEFKKACIIWGK